MATPSRKLIIDNVKTVLESVTTGNGYKSTVSTVEILAKSWLQVAQVIRPWIGIVPGLTKYEHLPARQVRSVFQIHVIVHVANGTQAQKRERLCDFEDDIWAALNVDTTRSANAISTTVIETETDEGDPESDGTMVMTIEVAYMRTTGST